MSDKYISIGQLTRYIKYKIDNDKNLDQVFIKGEISNFKAHSRGHYYFTIKDEEARINAVMFSTNVKKIKFLPQDGMKILATGKISVYPANGGYQIYVTDLQEDGVGNLYIAFEQLKNKLEQEGLFKKEHKKSLPKIPDKIGVVTAPTGAAIRDIISTIKRRWPLAEIYLFPCLVQGEFASRDIARQIKNADDFNTDVLIVGRGGGSIEDLWSFNEEVVARAIYNAKTPVISAVGHEIDFTIADFVADMRAPTPTGAAEISVPNLSDVENQLSQIKIRLRKNINHKLDIYRQRLEELKSRKILRNPGMLYDIKEQKLDILLDKIKYFMTNLVNDKNNRLEKIKSNMIFKKPEKIFDSKKNKYLNIVSKLEALSPLLTIKRGYLIAKKEDTVITSIKKVKKGDQLDLTMKDGEIKVEVI